MPTTDKFKPGPDDSVIHHKIIDQLLNEYDAGRHGEYPALKIERLKSAKNILGAQRELQCKYVTSLMARLAILEKKLNKAQSPPHAPEPRRAASCHGRH